MDRKIVLASSSPRRKDLLEQIGLEFEVVPGEYEEDMSAKDDPVELAKFLALKKTEDVARHYDDAIVIGADTFLEFNNKFIGKPKTREEAREMIKSLSGREHRVISGYAVIDTKNRKTINDIGEARVKFRDLSDNEIDDYIKTEEPMDKAGAYGMQGKASVLVEAINGDYYSVVGLPLSRVYCALRDMGVKIL